MACRIQCRHNSEEYLRSHFQPVIRPGWAKCKQVRKLPFFSSRTSTILTWLRRVNSKATLRVRTQDFMQLVPKILHPEIQASRYYAKNSKSLVIQGDGSRDRTHNVQECYRKLHALMAAAGKSAVRGETSPAQVEKVKRLFVFSD